MQTHNGTFMCAYSFDRGYGSKLLKQNKMKQDENGQLYELHTLKCGEQIWMYSDTLHKMYQLADVYGYDLEKGSDFNKVKQLVNN